MEEAGCKAKETILRANTRTERSQRHQMHKQKIPPSETSDIERPIKPKVPLNSHCQTYQSET